MSPIREVDSSLLFKVEKNLTYAKEIKDAINEARADKYFQDETDAIVNSDKEKEGKEEEEDEINLTQSLLNKSFRSREEEVEALNESIICLTNAPERPRKPSRLSLSKKKKRIRRLTM